VSKWFEIGSRILDGGIGPQSRPSCRKNDNKKRLTSDLEVTYHAQVQVLKMHHPWFFLKLASFAFFPLAGGPPAPLLSCDIFVGLNGVLCAWKFDDKNHDSKPALASSSGRYGKSCHTTCM